MFVFTLYISAFVFLSLWFYFKENSRLRNWSGKAFLLSFAAYCLLVFVLPRTGISMFSGATHVGGLLVGSLLLNTFSNSRFLFFGLMGLMVGTYGYFQMERVSNIKEASQHPDLNLDPEAELLVELSNGHQWSELSALLQKYGLTAQTAFVAESPEITELDDFFAVNIPEGQLGNIEEIRNAFYESGLIDFIENNEQIQVAPNASAGQPAPRPLPDYGLNDTEIQKLWAFEAMKMDEYFALLRQSAVKPTRKARIAIIDTGVDGNHEDLRDNFVSTRKEYNQDPHGHGTHCAGIAAAVGNNKKGIASFSLENDFTEVTSIQVFGKSGNTSQQRIINGMLLAADKGAAVLSMSLGGPTNDKIQRAYEQAVDYARTKGAVVVVAAGNENVDATYRAPAGVKGVITVSAVNVDLKKADFSNFVQNIEMGIAAPGVGIYSTFPDNKYEYLNGTSMATPYVSGLVGVLKAIKPQLKTTDIYKILKNSGLSTADAKSTGQLIYPAKALEQVMQY